MKSDLRLLLVVIGAGALACAFLARLTFDTQWEARIEQERRDAELDAAIVRLHRRVVAIESDLNTVKKGVMLQIGVPPTRP